MPRREYGDRLTKAGLATIDSIMACHIDKSKQPPITSAVEAAYNFHQAARRTERDAARTDDEAARAAAESDEEDA